MMHTIVLVVSWVAVVGVLSAYASKRSNLFDWANLICCVPVAMPAILLGAYSTAAISLCFGVIGAAHILWRAMMSASPIDLSKPFKLSPERRAAHEEALKHATPYVPKGHWELQHDRYGPQWVSHDEETP
jgi:hypothetical protein